MRNAHRRPMESRAKGFTTATTLRRLVGALLASLYTGPIIRLRKYTYFQATPHGFKMSCYSVNTRHSMSQALATATDDTPCEIINGAGREIGLRRYGRAAHGINAISLRRRRNNGIDRPMRFTLCSSVNMRRKHWN